MIVVSLPEYDVPTKLEYNTVSELDHFKRIFIQAEQNSSWNGSVTTDYGMGAHLFVSLAEEVCGPQKLTLHMEVAHNTAQVAQSIIPAA